MKTRQYNLKCECGWDAKAPTIEDGTRMARGHAICGTGHPVTATRPAHWVEGSIPVIAFIAILGKTSGQVHVTLYTTDAADEAANDRQRAADKAMPIQSAKASVARKARTGNVAEIANGIFFPVGDGKRRK